MTVAISATWQLASVEGGLRVMSVPRRQSSGACQVVVSLGGLAVDDVLTGSTNRPLTHSSHASGENKIKPGSVQLSVRRQVNGEAQTLKFETTHR